MTLKGIKVRIYPTKEQEVYIANLLGSCRFVYNEMVFFYDTYFREHGSSPTRKQAHLFFRNLKANYSFLCDVHSKVLSNARLCAMNAYANFFGALKKPKLKGGKLRFEKPQYHLKHKHDSCLFDRQAFRYIRGNRISLVKKLSNILFKCSKEDEVYLNHHQKRIRSITLRRKSSGIYICSILVDDIRIQPMRPAQLGPVGIDIGIKDVFVTSDGERTGNPRIFDTLHKRLARADKKLARCKVGSKRFEKARQHLTKIHEKIANVRDDFQHQITTKLVKEHSEVYTEDLSSKIILNTLHAARWFMDIAPGELVEKIKYKCGWYGRVFGKVDKYFPSSRTCSKCGFIVDKIPLEVREWDCPKCGCHHDRDINAAKNILSEGLKSKVGLGSPEPNARGQVNIGVGESLDSPMEMPWMNRESKCSSAVCSAATEP